MRCPTLITLLILLAAPLPGNAGLFGPSSYEECIEESLKGVGSDVAAKALILGCRKKFPTKEELEKRSLEDELQKKEAMRQSRISEGKKAPKPLQEFAVQAIVGEMRPSGLCTPEMDSCLFTARFKNKNRDWYVTSTNIGISIEGCQRSDFYVDEPMEPIKDQALFNLNDEHTVHLRVNRCTDAKHTEPGNSSINFVWYILGAAGFYLQE